LKEQLNSDLKQALRDRDKIKASCIRLVLSAVKNAEIAKRAELEETEILGVIAKEVKQRKESIEAFKQGNRQDLVAQEEAELTILMEHLPKQISRDEIITAARKIIDEVGAQGLGDKGRVMGKLIPQLKNRAEGSEINAVVSELLSR
jgi:uncharacterized protein YqeY